MSDLGENLKASIRAAIDRMGVTKAAGMNVERAVYESVIDKLCDQLDVIDERVRESNRVLQAIAYPVGYPQEWKAWRGEVPANGHHNGHHRGRDLEE